MPQVTADIQDTKKPDIFDVVEDVDLAETPLFNMIQKGTPPENDEFQWPADVPDAAVNTGTPDGKPWENPDSALNRDWIKGRIHHLETNYGVGVIAEGNKVAGTSGQSEMAYQAKRAMRKHVKSWERIIVGEQEAVVGDAASAGFVTRGLELWINSAGTGQTVPAAVPAAFRTEAAAIQTVADDATDLTETMLNNVMAAITGYIKRRGKWYAPCSLPFKRKVSSWGNLQPVAGVTEVTVRRFNRDASEKTLGQIIDIYFGDAGQITFETHFFLEQDAAQKMECCLLDMLTIRLRVRQAPKANTLPPDGTRKRGQVFSTAALQVGNPKFLGKFSHV